ncbi:hypothetical protein CEXT_739741 [Caerostris extrusa]|uniref:Uncharacterized protein n=1 Tax=Caerostris extrusa TaxID=172846 RepID=A0AAV4U8K3_CAEEX|nr:hypothetical protein CEXT_739741 [Caerostris extrusa]
MGWSRFFRSSSPSPLPPQFLKSPLNKTLNTRRREKARKPHLFLAGDLLRDFLKDGMFLIRSRMDHTRRGEDIVFTGSPLRRQTDRC